MSTGSASSDEKSKEKIDDTSGYDFGTVAQYLSTIAAFTAVSVAVPSFLMTATSVQLLISGLIFQGLLLMTLGGYHILDKLG